MLQRTGRPGGILGIARYKSTARPLLCIRTDGPSSEVSVNARERLSRQSDLFERIPVERIQSSQAIPLQALIHQHNDFLQRVTLMSMQGCNSPHQTVDTFDVLGAGEQRTRC
jgi:hypothetical protein